MSYVHYDRLTALDSVFLDLEGPSVHMHVGAVGIFEGGELVEDGGLDLDQLCAIAEADLRRVPRFRQRLARVPMTGSPVWVDDEHFNILYHVRHTSLPLPGDDRTLKRLVGRIMSQKLDRSKPLWELWFVEGLEGGRFAVISKVHHCLIDGISGVDLLAAFMGPDSGFRAEPDTYRWLPRPRPGPLSMLRDEIWHRSTAPMRAIRGATSALGHPGKAFETASRAINGFAEGVAKSLTPASETPFNVEIGPHRRFDWARFDLGAVREVKERVGGTINDVVLACVAGAVRSYLQQHDSPVRSIDFRTFVPVSTRKAEERGKLGNRVSLLIAQLPVDEPDPLTRLRKVAAETQRLKKSDQLMGTKAIEELSEMTAAGLLTQFSRLAAARRAYNVVVTNIPGPPVPVFLNGARLLASYPLVPLFGNQALGIALFSYDGCLHWGFNSDWDALADLHEFVLAVEREFEQLRKL